MIDRLLGDRDGGETLGRVIAIVEPSGVVVGWATVDLERAEIELGSDPADRAKRAAQPRPKDDLLGARCRLLDPSHGEQIVLLEPSTEGRLAAALARHGEGPVVAYLLTDARGVERARRAALALTAEGSGPFGAQRLVLGGQTSGPFYVITGLAGHEETRSVLAAVAESRRRRS